MKTCTKCGAEKTLDEFHKRKASPDGLKTRCKECILTEAREYRSRPEVKERASEYTAEYNARPEVKARIAACREEYYAKPENRERRRKYLAEYYRANRGQAAARQADYYQANKERISDYHRAYREANQERERERAHRRYVENPHFWWEAKYRRRAKEYGFEHLIESMESFAREDLIARYGDKCFHCGGEWSQLDHFPTPVIKGGRHSLKNCVPSCVPCNQRSWRQDV